MCIRDRLYAAAADFAALTGRETLLDLYCGAGTIGLSMAKRVKQLIGVEIIPEAVENARANALRNGVENARFLCGDAADAALALEREGISPDVVVIDPPRKGCAPGLTETIARMNPERVVMVSCDSATAAREDVYKRQLPIRSLSSGISGASRKAEEFLQAIIARRCPARKEPGPTFLPERHKTALNLYFLPKRK